MQSEAVLVGLIAGQIVMLAAALLDGRNHWQFVLGSALQLLLGRSIERLPQKRGFRSAKAS